MNRPPANALPISTVPKSDTALYVGLGAVVVLILVLLVAIVIGVAGSFGDDSGGGDETEEIDG